MYVCIHTHIYIYIYIYYRIGGKRVRVETLGYSTVGFTVQGKRIDIWVQGRRRAIIEYQQ